MISDLIDRDLLCNVRNEIQQNLSFDAKETDIYRIFQSGDLANLDGLDDESLKRLPSLKSLRDALYSQAFRQYLCEVTDSTFVSGRKTDMAINVYTPGCHLLCHDDVIGSRRISYILYLTDPDELWRAEWGGALQLYSTKEMRDADGKTVFVPEPIHTKSLTPAFNRLSFFAVQPGKSFHDVEEVYAKPISEDGTKMVPTRVAISGWYHIPQEGEEGYIDGEEQDIATRSSLAQLQGKGDIHDRPQPEVIPYIAAGRSDTIVAPSPSDDSSLSEDDLDFLLKYISATYLTPDTMDSVSELFQDECSILLDAFLSRRFSGKLRKYLELQETRGDKDNPKIWDTARPPHKHRYLYLRPSSSDAESPIQDILTNLVPSTAFRKWLQIATGQRIGTHDTIARRFRRGQDYTLAQSYESEEPRIEMCLSLTPSPGWGGDEVEMSPDKAKSQSTKAEARDDENPAVGGYLAYMAGGEDDGQEGSDDGVEVPHDMSTGGRATKSRKMPSDPAIYQAQEDDEDSNVLFSMPASWNKLGIVLRDHGTMRFVKYVSKSANGDRWDVVGEFGIDVDEDEDNGNEDEEERATNDDDELHDDQDNDTEAYNDESNDDDHD